MFDINKKVSNRSELLYIDILAYIYNNGGELNDAV